MLHGGEPAERPAPPGQRDAEGSGEAGRSRRHAKQVLQGDEPGQATEVGCRGGIRHHQGPIGRLPAPDRPGRPGPASPQNLEGQVVDAPAGLCAQQGGQVRLANRCDRVAPDGRPVDRDATQRSGSR